MNPSPFTYWYDPLSDAERATLFQAPDSVALKREFWRIVGFRFDPSWKRIEADHLQAMMNHRREAVKGLSDPSADVRSVAWQILLKNWKPSVDILAQCMDAIRRDPDQDVRVRAIFYLGALRRGAADAQVSAFFAEMILAPLTPPRIREAAYLGLLRVHGRPIPRELIWNVMYPKAEQPYPIDWEFARRFGQTEKQ